MNAVTDFELGQEVYGITKKGKIKVWSCDVFEFGHDHSLAGQAIMTITNRSSLDGKKIVRQERFEQGKNIGKANETTPYEQACSEAESRYRKQFDKGYTVGMPDPATAIKRNALGLPQPMLAKPCKEWDSAIEGTAWIQPKLDGHRAVVTRVDGKLIMYSRQGKLIESMQHILDHIDYDMDLHEGEFLDGELYVHGEHLQNIGSLIKKRQVESEHVQYHVYDMFWTHRPHENSPKPASYKYAPDATFRDRHLLLVSEFPTALPDDTPVKLVPTREIRSWERWALDEVAQEYVGKGFEGAIIRLDEKYEPGFRSDGLLKVKLFDDSEYKIIDVVEGKDRKVNSVDLKVACFVCEMEDGKTFEAVSMGDMYEKDRTWHNRGEYIGKTVTIKHSGYTKDGIPWHPVALRLREDI